MSDEEIENLDLKQKVEAENKLKEFVVDYVGDKVQPESGEVTVEMIVGVFASDFPEFLLAVAEENWIRGYKQAFHDMEAHDKQIAEEADTQKNEDE
jgi:hypothetical protein